MPENPGQFRICTLGNVTIFTHQVCSVVVIELRVGSQEMQKLFEASLETCRLDNLIHFRADAFYLQQANIVDFLWRQIRGSPYRDVVPVPFGSCRQVTHRDAFPCSGQVFVFGELQQAFVGWYNMLAV